MIVLTVAVAALIGLPLIYVVTVVGIGHPFPLNIVIPYAALAWLAGILISIWKYATGRPIAWTLIVTGWMLIVFTVSLKGW